MSDPIHVGNSQGIPRSIYLARILKLCFFPVLTVVAGNLAVLFVPQVRETLLAFDETVILSTQALWFILAFLLWMLCAWYVARLLVGRVFTPDLIGTCRSAAFSVGVTKHLPRLLALAAGLPMAGVLTVQGKPRGLGLLLAALSVVVFVGLVFRRNIGSALKQKWVDDWTPSERFMSFSAISVVGKIAVAAAFTLSAVLFVLITIGMESIARPIGSPALLLSALASWTVFGGFVLTYLPKAYGKPAMTWLPLLLALGSWPLNENHPVASGSSVAPVESKIAPRPALDELFYTWQQNRQDKTAPIIFVAAAGGASRAAYWTSSALGKLEDDTRGQSSSFADNLFVISSISGGSVGAAAYLTALDAANSRHDSGADGGATGECTSVRGFARAFTGEDHLSTVVGFLLFPDLVQRFLPFAVDSWDRSRALEEVWSRDWQRLQERCGLPARNPWNEPFMSLYQQKNRQWLPALAMSTTALGHGWPAMQANFTLRHPIAFDVLSTDLATDALTLSQAAHNSARFPYVSPAGVTRTHIGNKVWDRLGDGGYVEASGTLVLGEIIRELIRGQLICTRPDEYTCTAGETPCRKCVATTDQLRILVLDNTPTTRNGLLCDKDASSSAPAARVERRHNLIVPSNHTLLLPDVVAPLDGAFSTRGGRGAASEIELLHLAGGCGSDHYAELRLSQSAQRDPSMNWMLNRASRQQMDAALDTPGQETLLQENLQIAESWIR